jgi:hypothetical protein
LRGEFFIDEAGNVSHGRAIVIWGVSYGGDFLCEVKVHWHETGECRIEDEVIVGPGAVLEVDERVYGKDPNYPLYAGIFKPRLVVEGP